MVVLLTMIHYSGFNPFTSWLALSGVASTICIIHCCAAARAVVELMPVGRTCIGELYGGNPVMRDLERILGILRGSVEPSTQG